MFKTRGGGGKGRLNNVQKNRRFGPAGCPVDLSQIKGKIVTTFWYIGHFFPKIYALF